VQRIACNVSPNSRRGLGFFGALLLALVVELREFPLYLIRNLASEFNIYQWAMIHPRTVFSSRAALAGLVEQFRPVGERTALQRLDRVHGATVGEEEWTLFMAWFPKAQQRRGAAEVTPLEFRVGNSKVFGEACNVFAGKVNETLLLAAANASGLALKAHGRV
jgi:hypothetical protein